VLYADWKNTVQEMLEVVQYSFPTSAVVMQEHLVPFFDTHFYTEYVNNRRTVGSDVFVWTFTSDAVAELQVETCPKSCAAS
tara:strand:- start:694 stop:936 length:243 start_codon:yes stop_codon:yes gene_type:complete